MLRILDLPEPLLPISRTLRFFVFLISVDRPAVLVLVGAVVAAIMSGAPGVGVGLSMSKWNSDSVETVPRDEQLLVVEEERDDEACAGQVRERSRCCRPTCRSRSSSRSAN